MDAFDDVYVSPDEAVVALLDASCTRLRMRAVDADGLSTDYTFADLGFDVSGGDVLEVRLAYTIRTRSGGGGAHPPIFGARTPVSRLREALAALLPEWGDVVVQDDVTYASRARRRFPGALNGDGDQEEEAMAAAVLAEFCRCDETATLNPSRLDRLFP